MNKLFIGVLLMLLNSQLAFCQYPVSANSYDSQKLRTGHWTILYDSAFHETSNLDSVVYYRTARFEAGKPIGKVRDFYASGKKQWDGFLLSVDPEVIHGEMWYYHENGKVSQHSLADHGKLNGFYKTYYLNGNLSSEGTMRNDSAEGEWKYYFENGILQSKVTFQNGLSNGPCVVYHPNGLLQGKGQFLKNEKNGYWEFFHENGFIKSKVNYLNGYWDGAHETYNEQGILTAKGGYKDGEYAGTWQYYHENGKVKCLGKNLENGKKTGEWRYFGTEGQLTNIENYENGELQGTIQNFYSNGPIESTVFYEKGLRKGLFHYYFENGKILRFGHYLADSAVGKWCYYYESGQKNAEGNYVDNKKDSIWNYYFENGALSSNETLLKGILNGKETEYHPNGQLKINTNFLNGQKDGFYQSFYDNGKLETEGNFQSGKRVGKWTSWYTDGTRCYEGKYVDGQKEGEWKWYFENGLIKDLSFYKEGYQTGIGIGYYDNGNKRIECEVNNSKKEGLATFYSKDGSVYSQGNYLNGERSGKWFFNDSITHTKASEGVYTNGNLDGKWNLFDSNGKVKSVNYYKNGFWETESTVSDSIDRLTTNEEYEKALERIEELKRIIKRDKNKHTALVALPYFHYASIYLKQYKYEKSLANFQKYAELILKYKGDTVFNYATAMSGIAENQKQLEQYDEALNSFDKSLDVYKKLNKQNTTSYINVLMNKAYVYSAMKKNDLGEQLVVEELKRKQALFGINHPETFHNLLTTGQYFNYIDKETESLNYYQQLQKACEKEKDTYSSYYIDATRECSSLLHFLGKDTEALNEIKTVINFSLKKGKDNTIQFLTDCKIGAVYFASLAKPDTAHLLYEAIHTIATANGWSNTDVANEAAFGLAIYHADNYENKKALDLYTKIIHYYESSNRTETNLFANILHAYGSALIGSDNSKIEEALTYYQRCIEIKKKLFGESNSQYIVSLINLAGLYTSANRFSEAENTLQIASELAKQNFGTESSYFASCRSSLAYIKIQQNRLQLSIDYYKEASSFYKKHLDKHLTDYTNALNYISIDFQGLGLLDSATYYSQFAADTYRAARGEDKLEYLTLAYTLAQMYIGQDRYSDAERILLNNEKKYLSLVGKDHFSYATSLENLGDFYKNKGDNRKAKNYYTAYKQAIEKLFGKTADAYMNALASLANITTKEANYTEAEKIYTEIDEIIKDKYGVSHIKFARNLGYLGDVCFFQKRYNEAEKYYQQGIQIYLKIEGTNSTDLANLRNKYAKLCTQLDKNKEAEEIYKENVAVYANVIGTESFYYLNALADLSDFYVRFGQYAEAEKIKKQEIEIAFKKDIKIILGHKWYNYAMLLKDWNMLNKADSVAQKALKIYEDILERNNISILNTRNLLGIIALKQLRFEEAGQHFQFCISESKAKKEENTHAHATFLNNQSLVEMEQKHYEVAEQYLNQAALVFSKTTKKGSLNEIVHLDNFAALYQAWGKYELAEKYWLDVNKKLFSYVNTNFYFMSDSEKAQFWLKNKEDFEDFNTFALLRAKQNPAILCEMYNNQLATKGILLSASNKIKKRILASRDTTLINEYQLWRATKEKLAKAYLLSEAEQKEQQISIPALETTANKLEKSLNITAQDIQKEQVNATWKDIQKVLSKTEAAIEIVRFRYFDKHQTDSIVYAALILTAETKANPVVVVLPNGAELEGKSLKYYKNAIRLQLEDENSYRNYWAPFAGYLKNKSKIYISLDGVYNAINMNTLRIADGTYLIDSLDIKLVSNTKDILEIKSQKQVVVSKPSASLFGYPTFFIGNKESKDAKKSEIDRSGIVELPGTKIEIEKIEAILSASNWLPEHFMGENASENALKSVQNPRVLHIATHGMFVDDKNNMGDNVVMNRWQAQQNPLLKVGLLLSGAANYFQDESVFSSENGILTAYEAANLNLENTDLVILSACETGKGEIKNGEGVYGMQRAFQTAGAKAIVMSLWKVDDNATQQLMTRFYTNWMNGVEKQLAFKTAQMEIKKQFKKPYYWGAFVLVGN